MIIEGAISVKAAILSDKRKINKIYILKGKKDKDTNFIKKICINKDIPFEFVGKTFIDSISNSSSNGGVIGDVGYRKSDDFESLFSDKNFLCMIDGIEDPYNFGYSIRSLYSAGCTGIILNNRSYKDSEATILRSSAGAYDFINIFMSSDMVYHLNICKKRGIKLISTFRSDAKVYYKENFNENILICFGGEKRGISKNILDICDSRIYIPYSNNFRNSLNLTSAISVISFEVLRQRSL